ncbi:MAG: HEAT repeat domain-containing protein [Thermoleophilia bacterium]
MGLFGPPNVARLDAMGKIDGLLRAARYKKDAAVRDAAREALTGYLDQLIKRLQTKNLVQLRTSREALVIVGEPAREKLIFILREGHLHRRQDAAFVLGEMRDPAAVGPLCVAIHNPDPLLRLLIVQALVKIGGAEGADTLRKALGDPDPKVADEARKALKKLGALK